MKKAALALSVLLLLATVAPVYAETYQTAPMGSGGSWPYQIPAAQPSGDAMIFDLFVVRPLAIASFFIGTGVAVIATPFAAASGTTKPVYNALLNQPYDFAFCRPLGEGF